MRAHPEKQRRLQELLFLLIDEFGQVGAALLEAMNLVLQKTRGNGHPFGGVCVIAAGDNYQTEPVGMIPTYRSMLFRANFQALSLRQLYRARRDPVLQKVIEFMRVSRMTEEGVWYVLNHVAPAARGANTAANVDEREQTYGHCTHHRTAAAVPRDTVWLLSKKSAVNKARDAAFNEASATKKAYDAEDTYITAMTWQRTGDERVRKALDRHTQLVRHCYAIDGHRVTVTQNFCANGRRVANGQKGRVVSHDDNTVTVHFDSAPHEECIVHRILSLESMEFDGRVIKRRQFPLELAAATTIHDVQGETVPELATYLDGDPEHVMWPRMMLFTLFTRKKCAESISWAMTRRCWRVCSGTTPHGTPRLMNG